MVEVAIPLALIAGFGAGYLTCWWMTPSPVAPNVVPFPFPVAVEPPPTKPPATPSFAVSLSHPDGTYAALTVPRRTHRLFYDGRAWEHTATHSGVWVYEAVDRDTERQAQRKAWPTHA